MGLRTGVVFAVFASASMVHAETFQVSTAADAGAGSLRKAIVDANAAQGTNSISISATGTLTLETALPAITSTLTISGPGADQFTIAAKPGGGFRVFSIEADTQILGLTIR